MAVHFHSKKIPLAYTTRDVDPGWEKMLLSRIEVQGKHILDMGCGGGIYTKALAHLGGKEVTGLDFSKEMLHTAEIYCSNETNVNFVLEDANKTSLPSNQFDIILNRAIIHHLKNLPVFFAEVFRLLKPGGIAVVQDRTLEDCLLPGDHHHLYGYFFEFFPTLISFERNRRPLNETVTKQLYYAGFSEIESTSFWETKKYYYSLADLERDLTTRTGRSILDELNDAEVKKLTKYISKQLTKSIHADSIEEKDRWTIWIAKKGDK